MACGAFTCPNCGNQLGHQVGEMCPYPPRSITTDTPAAGWTDEGLIREFEEFKGCLVADIFLDSETFPVKVGTIRALLRYIDAPGIVGEGYEPVVVRMAQEIAPQLDELLNQLMSTCGDAAAKRELAECLWDNKVGILRVLQAVCASPPPSAQGRDDVLEDAAKIADAAETAAHGRMEIADFRANVYHESIGETEAASSIAQGIRALKSKENGNG